MKKIKQKAEEKKTSLSLCLHGVDVLVWCVILNPYEGYVRMVLRKFQFFFYILCVLSKNNSSLFFFALIKTWKIKRTLETNRKLKVFHFFLCCKFQKKSDSPENLNHKSLNHKSSVCVCFSVYFAQCVRCAFCV